MKIEETTYVISTKEDPMKFIHDWEIQLRCGTDLVNIKKADKYDSYSTALNRCNTINTYFKKEVEVKPLKITYEF